MCVISIKYKVMLTMIIYLLGASTSYTQFLPIWIPFLCVFVLYCSTVLVCLYFNKVPHSSENLFYACVVVAAMSFLDSTFSICEHTAHCNAAVAL